MTGPDHLSALALLSVGNTFRAFVLGVRWGIGHRRDPELAHRLRSVRAPTSPSADVCSLLPLRAPVRSLGLFMVAVVFFLSSRRLDLDQVGRSGAPRGAAKSQPRRKP